MESRHSRRVTPEALSSLRSVAHWWRLQSCCRHGTGDGHEGHSDVVVPDLLDEVTNLLLDLIKPRLAC